MANEWAVQPTIELSSAAICGFTAHYHTSSRRNTVITMRNDGVLKLQLRNNRMRRRCSGTFMNMSFDIKAQCCS